LAEFGRCLHVVYAAADEAGFGKDGAVLAVFPTVADADGTAVLELNGPGNGARQWVAHGGNHSVVLEATLGYPASKWIASLACCFALAARFYQRERASNGARQQAGESHYFRKHRPVIRREIIQNQLGSDGIRIARPAAERKDSIRRRVRAGLGS